MVVLLLAMLGCSVAAPRQVTLNGVDVTALRDQKFVGVDVWIDADGNVHLSSARYQVQLEQDADVSGLPTPPRTTPPRTEPGSTPDPAGASTGAPSAVPPDPEPSGTASARPARITPDAVTTVPAGTPPPGSWWLATEDNASRGHEARVYINGSLVKTVRSGEPQVIHDVSRYLRRGENAIMIQTRSLAPTGGGFYVYVGQGSNAGGTVTLEQPEIQHGLGPSRKGDDVREFVLVVD